MGITKRNSSNGDVKDRKDESLLAEQKVTFLACFQGAVASLGGFIFGYIRLAFVMPCNYVSL